jgi:hypothetical protein
VINLHDDTPEVTLSLTGSSLAEARGVATVTAHLSFAAPQDVIVNLACGGAPSASPTARHKPIRRITLRLITTAMVSLTPSITLPSDSDTASRSRTFPNGMDNQCL